MCLVCERIRRIQEGENPYFVRELETGYVVIGDYQHFKGYTLFLCKEHRSELYELEPRRRLRFLEEMALVTQAVSSAFDAEKMNCELLGNGDAHLHWHLFPRVSGDLEGYGNDGRGPVWWYPRERMYHHSNRPDERELAALRQRLAGQLELLLGPAPKR